MQSTSSGSSNEAAASRTGTFVRNFNLSTTVKIYYSQLRLSHSTQTHTHAYTLQKFYAIWTWAMAMELVLILKTE